MNSKNLYAVACASVFIAASSAANAALVSRLGGQAYYDTESNLTWLTNANAAGTAMNWYDASTWVANLNIGGVTGWRLPNTLRPDATCSTQSFGDSYGYNCRGSEMGNMFYNILGGVAAQDIATTHNTNFNLFSNIQSSTYYWSATEEAPGADMVFEFSFGYGFQSNYASKSPWTRYAWAVRSGDVSASAVPLPAAVWLFGSGLLGLIGIAKRKK